VVDSNVVYQFLRFYFYFLKIRALLFNNTNFAMWPFHVAFGFIKLNLVFINLGHLFLQPHFCRVSLQRSNVNFLFICRNKSRPSFSMTLMLPLVRFKIDLDFSTCHIFVSFLLFSFADFL
jgi:hypothetical protein